MKTVLINLHMIFESIVYAIIINQSIKHELSKKVFEIRLIFSVVVTQFATGKLRLLHKNLMFSREKTVAPRNVRIVAIILNLIISLLNTMWLNTPPR